MKANRKPWLCVAMLLVAVLAVLAVGGCTSKISNLSLVSTANVQLSQKYTLVASDVSAKTSQLWVLLYFGGEDQSYYKAMGDLLAQNDGDLLTDVEITTSGYWFLIGVYNEYRVTGDVWRRADAVGALQVDPAELFTLQQRDGHTVLVSDDGQTIHEVDGGRS